MPSKNAAPIVLPLCDLRDLVVTPTFDPFEETSGSHYPAEGTAENELYEPGLEYLVSRLRGSRLAKPRHLVLTLPPDQATPDVEDRVRRVIRRYCRHYILESKRTLNEPLWTGLKALQVGLVFLASCLFLASLIAQARIASGSFGDFLTQGLTIIGWVSLWRPVEIFLYEWWPQWRAVRLYDYIQRMEVVIQPRR